MELGPISQCRVRGGPIIRRLSSETCFGNKLISNILGRRLGLKTTYTKAWQQSVNVSDSAALHEEYHAFNARLACLSTKAVSLSHPR